MNGPWDDETFTAPVTYGSQESMQGAPEGDLFAPQVSLAPSVPPPTGEIAGMAGLERGRASALPGGQPPPAAGPGLPPMPMMPMGPAGSSVRTTSGGQRGRPFDPAEWAAIGEQQQAAGAVALQRAGAVQQSAQMEAREIGRLQQVLEKRSADYMAKRQQYAKEMLDPAEQKLMQQVDNLGKMKVDPNRLWSNAETWQNVTMTLGTAIGGFVQGFTQGRVGNAAAKAIESAVNRDIQSQVANIQTAKAGVGAQQGIVGMLYRRLGDMDQAERVGRQALMASAQLELQKIGAMNKGTAAAFEAQIAIHQMEAKRLGMMVDAKNRAYGTRTWSATKTPGAAADPLSAYSKMLDIRLKQQRLTGTSPGELRRAEKMNRLPTKVIEEVASIRGSLRDLENFARLYMKHGGLGNMAWVKEKFGITDANHLRAWMRQMALQTAATDNQGRPTDKDLDMVINTLPNSLNDKRVAMMKLSRVIAKARRRLTDTRDTFNSAGYKADWVTDLSKKEPEIERLERGAIGDGSGPSGFLLGGRR